MICKMAISATKQADQKRKCLMDIEAYIETWIERNIGEEDTITKFASYKKALLRDLNDAGLLPDNAAVEIDTLSGSMIASRLREQTSESDHEGNHPGGAAAAATDDEEEDEDTSDLPRD